MNPALEQDEIRLSVPARPAYSRVVRQAAGGLAARLGFSYDQLDEVRLAVAEAWSVLLGPDEWPGTVRAVLRVQGPGALAITLALDTGPVAPSSDTAVAVLTQIADEVDVEPGRVGIVLRAR